MTALYRTEEPIIITLTPLEGTPQRIRLQPIAKPDVELRIERQTWRGCHWHATGSEYIERVEISNLPCPDETQSKTADREIPGTHDVRSTFTDR